MQSSSAMDRVAVFFRLLFWSALVFAVTMALMPKPPAMLGEVKDKYQHILAFSCLALCASLAYRRAPLMRIAERLSFLGAVIEVLQSIPALHRDCDIMDWIADTAAILTVLALVAIVRKQRADVRTGS